MDILICNPFPASCFKGFGEKSAYRPLLLEMAFTTHLKVWALSAARRAVE